jgi:hypothetical protein
MIPQSEFDQMKFETYGFIEPKKEEASHRVPKDYERQNGNFRELRNAIINTVHEFKDSRKGSTITELINYSCNIPGPTYKQYMSGKGVPTRPFIAKICVGLGLSVDKANELFRLHSGELNLTNDADYITYNALLSHDSIYDYEEELERYTGNRV